METVALNAKKTRGKPFEKGNPGGGRPKISQELLETARAASPKAMQALINILEAEDARPSDVIRAAEAILNRAWGTPVQSVELANKAGEELKLKIEYVSKTK